MAPGPSFTIPATPDLAPADSDPAVSSLTSTPPTEQREPFIGPPSASASTEVAANGSLASDGAGSQSASDALRRSEPGLGQPKHCARCGQVLDALPPSHDRQPNLSRTSSSVSMSAPSPSSYAFAPDSIRSQHRLQTHQNLTSAINAAAAVALSRHLGAEEAIHTDADGHAICAQCAAQLAEASATPANSNDPTASNTHPPASSAASHVIDTQQLQPNTSRTSSLNASTTSSSHHVHVGQRAEDTQGLESLRGHSAPSSGQAPQVQLTISVDNMGAGGDAARTQSDQDIHMHDPTAFPPLERAPISPSLRVPSSPPGVGRSGSRSRIRFADASMSHRDVSSQEHNTDVRTHTEGSNANASSSYGLGRSGSFSRSLSYSGPGIGPESVSSASAPVVVSFPPCNVPTPATELTSILNTQNSQGVASSITPSSSLPGQPSVPQPRLRSNSHLRVSASLQGSTSSHFVPAPAHAIPGGVKQRRPSSTRRLSRSGSTTGPTTVPFAAVGTPTSADTSASKDDPYGPNAVTRPRLSVLPTHVIAEELYHSARHWRPASLISSSTSTSLTASSSSQAAGIDPSRAVKYHLDPLSYPTVPGGKEEMQEEAASMDVDNEHATSRLAIKWGDVRWVDPYKPDPLAELSRLRTPPKGRGCLYPGATFNGTQKSGRNSYDVTVRIVNVDLEASHLCGYLNIRGLTEDWPELTTYFDAEIIGDRYGFVTGKWGATEADDLKHWARFPPFRPLRSALSKPGLRFNHLNKPFVFMRWKEKFLVPDHRVRDINGASFAGFYYVCVELGESAGQPPAAAHTEVRGRSNSNVSMASATTGGHSLSPAASPTPSYLSTGSSSFAAPAVSGPQWYAARTQRRRELSLSAPSTSQSTHPVPQQSSRASGSNDNNSNLAYYHPVYHPHSPHALAPSGPGFWPASPTSPHLPLSAGFEDSSANMWAELESEPYDDMGAMGKMSGFYFHENSEPYQQLSLHHTPEACSSSFEMR